MNAHAHKPGGGAHATVRTYLMVALVLAVLTLIEFGVLYLPGGSGIAVPVLLLLSVAKFALVAMFFMHLKFDSKVFSLFFVPGLALAAMVAASLAALMHVHM